MIDSVVGALSWLPAEWLIFFISILPIIELRGAIPVGIAMGLPAWETFLIAIAGNGIVALVLLLALPKFFEFFCRFPRLRPVLDRIVSKARNKGQGMNAKGMVGLLLFVAVPLPGTGVWTGCLLAYLLGMRICHALLAVTLGMIIAGVLMTLGSLGLMTLVGDIEIALLIILAVLIAAYVFQKIHRRRKQ